MKIFVFDIDNTLIIHTNIENNFYNKKNESKISEMISSLNIDKLYIYTNGTYGHGEGVVNNLKLKGEINKIYGRDTIPYMKPLPESFHYVNNEINKGGGPKFIFSMTYMKT